MDKLIYKYLSNKANLQEKMLLLRWLKKSKENRIKFSNLKQIHTIGIVADEIEHIDIDITFLKKHIENQRRKSSINRYLLRYSVAAAIIIGVFITGIKIGIRTERPENIIADRIVEMEYSTPYGVKGKIILPDSSVVWLNSGSKINFPSKFSGKSRNVSFNGEAFFEIRKDSCFPMKIFTSHNLNIIVTGTSFNLHSYCEDPFFSLYLSEGKVRIQDKKGNLIHIVKEDETIEYNFFAKAIKSKNTIEPNSIIGWKKGWLIFNEEELSSVFRKMERWYGISFKISDKFNLRNKLTAKFREESASQVLDLMKKISLIDYSIKDSIVFIKVPQ